MDGWEDGVVMLYKPVVLGYLKKELQGMAVKQLK